MKEFNEGRHGKIKTGSGMPEEPGHRIHNDDSGSGENGQGSDIEECSG